jgi:hypothetical protein
VQHERLIAAANLGTKSAVRYVGKTAYFLRRNSAPPPPCLFLPSLLAFYRPHSRHNILITRNATIVMASKQPEQATFASPTPLHPSRISFADLRFEIRTQIWNLTFEPRILCLHINQHAIPAPLDPDGKRIDQSSHTLSIGFDCSIVTSCPLKEFDEYRERLMRLAWQANLESSGESSYLVQRQRSI